MRITNCIAYNASPMPDTTPALEFTEDKRVGPTYPKPNNMLCLRRPSQTVPTSDCLTNKHASGQGHVILCESNCLIRSCSFLCSSYHQLDALNTTVLNLW